MPEPPADPDGPGPKLAGPGSGAKGRVLVVDDNALFARAIAAMVAHAGAHADVVHDGFAALAALGLAHYDLIFLDLEMPGLDGRRTALEIRRRYGRRPPIVLVSAHSGRALTALAAGAGVDDRLSKPFDQAELDAILARWLWPPPPAGDGHSPGGDGHSPGGDGHSPGGDGASVAQQTIRAGSPPKGRPPR